MSKIFNTTQDDALIRTNKIHRKQVRLGQLETTAPGKGKTHLPPERDICNTAQEEPLVPLLEGGCERSRGWKLQPEKFMLKITHGG